MIEKFTSKVESMRKSHKIAFRVLVLLVCVGILIFILVGMPAQAGGYNSGDTTDITNNYYSQDKGNPGGNDDYKKATAAAFALGVGVVDYSKGWQGVASGGFYDDETAIAAQLYTRVDDIMVGGGVSCDTDFDQCGGAISGSWHF